ncbi:MAG: Rieske (2Fe-2S) protein [Actinomycetota bacterium]|nr:Rieske (2Fe-2S) protein [Actinomycetota bacterium]
MFPELRTRNPARARGDRLVAISELGVGGVREVETERHGTLAVGVIDGEPFAVSNVCRHQFAKLGQGQIRRGCLECPWHRARYDVETGGMVSGPKGRIFGFGPYSRTIQAYTNTAFRLRRFSVEERDGVIVLR